jgi:hypothetical protein
MATALEARYAPVLAADYIHLVNAEPIEYGEYRAAFDPVAMSEMLRYSPEQVRNDAEELLLFGHSINPLSGPLDQLLRRVPRSSWKHFKGDALSIIGIRETAEILLRFYEDLVECGAAPALPPPPTTAVCQQDRTGPRGTEQQPPARNYLPPGPDQRQREQAACHLRHHGRESDQHRKGPAVVGELLHVPADRADQAMPAHGPVQAHQCVPERDDRGGVRRDGACRRPADGGRGLRTLNASSAHHAPLLTGGLWDRAARLW